MGYLDYSRNENNVNRGIENCDVSLGSITRFASPSTMERREKRYQLQDVAGDLLPDERVAWCCKKSISKIVVKMNEDSHCYYHGLMQCGSIWTCTVCASKISEKRREELQKASEAGYTMILVTLTLQHDREDEVGQKIDELCKALRKMRSGKGWQMIEEKYSLVASCSGLEITFSQANGYHPHKHLVFFSKIKEKVFNIQEFDSDITAKWLHCLEAFGAYGSEYHAVKVTMGKKETASYIAKWGIPEEVTKTNLKEGKEGHYSFWQVLDMARQGEKWAISAFKEYAAATKGKRWLFWSKGARALLGLDIEKTDEEIANEEEGKEKDWIIYEINRNEWRLILKYKMRAAILNVGENAGLGGIEWLIMALKEREYKEKHPIIDGFRQ